MVEQLAVSEFRSLYDKIVSQCALNCYMKGVGTHNSFYHRLEVKSYTSVFITLLASNLFAF